MDLNNLPTFGVLPKHIGFIMDGNGRWAKERGLPRCKGHIAAVAFEAQRAGRIDAAPWDVPMERVYTENGVYPEEKA